MPKCVYRRVNSLSRPFFAAITHKGKSIYLGSYRTETEASRAVEDARKKYTLKKGKGEKRAHKRWTEEERERLTALSFPQSSNVYKQMSAEMGRSVNAVYHEHWSLSQVKRRY